MLGKAPGGGVCVALLRPLNPRDRIVTQARAPQADMSHPHFAAMYAVRPNFLFLKNVFLPGELAACFVS